MNIKRSEYKPEILKWRGLLLLSLLLIGRVTISAVPNEALADQKDAPKKEVFHFGQDQWTPDDWLLVRSPRWEERSRWIQEKDGIVNQIPDDLDLANMGRRAGETYVSMLYKKPFRGHCRFALECSFQERMAPLIVLSPKLLSVYEEHLEIVLYDHGVNVWQHYGDGRHPSWKLLAFMDRPLKSGERHRLEATLLFDPKGSFIQISCDGQTASVRIDGDWPLEYYAGFTACEGRNKFYSFEADENPALSDGVKERVSY